MRHLGTALLIFYSLVFWAATFTWITLIFAVTWLATRFMPYIKSDPWVARPGFALVPRLGGTRVRVHYHPQFDKGDRSVFCFNHVNLLDAFVASKTIPHTFCGIMHAWQFKIPLYGWMMHLSRGIRVHPQRKDNLLEMTRQAIERQHDGFSILAFPEGGRTRDGRIRRFHKGVLLVARDAGYPVVPVAVRGSFAINQRGSWIFRPGGTIEVVVGPQYSTVGLSNCDIERLAHTLELWVKGFVETSVCPHDYFAKSPDQFIEKRAAHG